MQDHCTTCHETFDENETIMHNNGSDECPKCGALNAVIGIGNADVCPACDWDCQLEIT